jgi:hypothetical protein
MKKVKIAYWVFTALVSLMMLMSAFMYLASPQMSAAFAHIGFPQYFRIELAVAKMLGVIILLLPRAAVRLKEWAYAGFGFAFVSALIAHISVGDRANVWIGPLIAMGLLAGSYITYIRLNEKKVLA